MVFFYLLVVIMPLYTHPLWGYVLGDAGNMTLFKVVGLVCVAYAVLHLTQVSMFPPYFRTWQERLFLVYYIACVISAATMQRWAGLTYSPLISDTSFLVMLFVTVSIVDSNKRLFFALLSAVGSVGVASLYVLREWQKYHNVYPNFRPGSVTGDSNYFALSALICVPVAYYVMIGDHRRWHRIFCGACLAVTIPATLLGASRGGFLGLIATALVVVWNSRRRARNLAGIAIVLVPLSLLLPNSPVRRLINPNYSDDSGKESRIIAWKAGIDMIKEHPFLGVGVGNFKAVVEHYEDPSELMVKSLAHNTYIGVAAELGIPVLAVFVAMMGCTFFSLNSDRNRARRKAHVQLSDLAAGLQAGLAGAVVAIGTLTGEYHKLFWLVIFLSVCSRRLVRSLPKKRSRMLGATTGMSEMAETTL